MMNREKLAEDSIRIADQFENIAAVDPDEAMELALAYIRVASLQFAGSCKSKSDFTKLLLDIFKVCLSEGSTFIDQRSKGK